MYFTNYIVTENTGSSTDPLGFLRPSSILTDKLFKQFTVLSNHPAYHGFVCFTISYLYDKGIELGDSKFSKDFRLVESLWGIINAKNNESILNITKYNQLPGFSDASVSVNNVEKYMPLFERLNYGALGHYTTSSVFWGLLTPKEKNLTDLGQELADAWCIRGGIDFKKLCDEWMNGNQFDNLSDINIAIKKFSLSGMPSVKEQKVWKKCIKAYKQKIPEISELWSKPLDINILELNENEEKYKLFFPRILKYYNKNKILSKIIGLCECFELVAGMILFIFEWEYICRLKLKSYDTTRNDKVFKKIQENLRSKCIDYRTLSGGKSSWKLAEKLSNEKDYKNQFNIILDHHVKHQKSKGAMPFMNMKSILIYDKVKPQNTIKLYADILENKEVMLPKFSWNYRRNWHFHRANKWLRYAGEIK